MTRADEIRDLFAYNRWANLRILDAAAALDDDALARDLGSSFPSVLATIAHLLDADWLWLRRWLGESPTAMPADWDRSSLDALRATWDDIEADRTALLARLDDPALAREVSYRDMAGTPWTSRMDDMLRHVVNHSTYHRGQIVTMLRQLGATPPATDLIAYHRQRAPA
jgi:uncharacterized damage-inducible protein DinB